MVGVRLQRRDSMSQNEVKRHLVLLAQQVGGDEKISEVKSRLRAGEAFWKIALDLGASAALVAELGGPRI